MLLPHAAMLLPHVVMLLQHIIDMQGGEEYGDLTDVREEECMQFITKAFEYKNYGAGLVGGCMEN